MDRGAARMRDVVSFLFKELIGKERLSNVSPKQRAFAEHIIEGRNGVRFNAAQSAIPAGYSKRSARSISFETPQH